MVEVVVVGGGGGGVGRNLFEDPILRRGELFVPNLEEKGLLLLNEVWVVGGVVGGVGSRVCLKEFLRLGLLVITSSLAGLSVVLAGGGLAGLARLTLGLSRTSWRATGAGRDISWDWTASSCPARGLPRLFLLS